jgi:hypothetical protein
VNDLKWSLLAGALAAGFLLGYLAMSVGHELMAVKSVVMHGSLYPGSAVTNLAGLGILSCGLLVSVCFGMLILIRSYGRRSSGAMLRETNLNAQRGMSGLEELRENRGR